MPFPTLNTMIDRFSRLKPIKKLMVGIALASSVLVGGYSLDRAVDADWGQDSSGWTEAQKAQRHHERWQKIGQGLVIVLQALEEANRNAPQQQQPTQYPDNYPTTTTTTTHDSDDYNYNRRAPHSRDQARPQRHDQQQLPQRQQQQPPAPKPDVQKPDVQQPQVQTPPVVVTPPAPTKPPVDWKEKYKHLDDFNNASKPRSAQPKPSTDPTVPAPNTNGDWMSKYKNVVPQQKATTQKAAPQPAHR